MSSPPRRASLEMPLEKLRGVGLSRQKASYLQDLCTRVQTGALALDALDAMSDDEVMATLTAVKGIGRWTAEMILIFQLQRPDVLPVDDVGLLRSIQRVYGLKRRPTEKQVLRMGEKWRPYRSIASWYLWAELDSRQALGFWPWALGPVRRGGQAGVPHETVEAELGQECEQLLRACAG